MTAAAEPAPAASPPPTCRSSRSSATREGEVNILAWPGYAEDGSTDPAVDWVTPFEEETGCQTNVKYFATSDEAVNLMKTGEYDVVSASGDASLRMIAAGDVEPVNTDLIPNYADIYPFLKDRDWNSVDGSAVRRPARLRRQPADVPHRRGDAGPHQLGARCSRRTRRTPARSRRTTRRSTSPTRRST